MAEANAKGITVTKTQIAVPFSVVIALVGYLARGLDQRLEAISQSQQQTQQTLVQFDHRLWLLEQRAGDRWTGTDQVVWASELARTNRGLTVPPPVARLALEGPR